MIQSHKQSLSVIVVGGGPAGLMAATEAALTGCPVLLLEKEPALGRKLLITGSGRCNVTNQCEPALLTDHFFSGGRFLRGAFSRFSNADLIGLLQQAGISLIEEPEGKIFPASGLSGDILAFLVARAQSAGVRIMTGEAIDSVITEQGHVTAVQTKTRSIAAYAVVLAMGGRSWPGTGSNGDGTRIAADLGHRVMTERPALVPLLVADPTLHLLQGLALRDIHLRLMLQGQVAAQNRGDLLFTHFGVSGPAVLRVSRFIPDPFPKSPVVLSLDLLADDSIETVERKLIDLFTAEPRKLLRNSLADWLPTAFVPHLLRLAGLPEDLDGRNVTLIQRKKLLQALKDCRIAVSGTRGYKEAMITAGGVDLVEIDPKTMGSRIVSGLFLAGEMLDIDADTGGYNLQAAWSTGFVAGRAAASHCLMQRNLI